MFFRKKFEKQEKFEKELYKAISKKLQQIEDVIEKEDKLFLYNQIKSSYINYFRVLLTDTGMLTEVEILEKLRSFNIGTDILSKIRKLFNFFIKVDYNNQEFKKEDLYGFLEDTKHVVEQIYTQKEADILSKEEKMSKKDKEKIEKSFVKSIDKIKKNYNAKKEILKEDVIKATEYYNILPSKIKEKYLKDFHYFCSHLPYLLQLIKEANEAGKRNQKELHQVIVKINKVFLKLDDHEQEDASSLFLKALDSEEENLNIGIMIGYNQIHQKNFEKATRIYKRMLEHYKKLNSDKKAYYKSVLMRYLQHLKNATVSKEEKIPISLR